MSNQAFIVRTRFQDLDQSGTVIGTSYGIRVFDGHEITYDNVAVASEAELLEMSKADLVRLAKEINDKAQAIVEFAEEERSGLFIDGDFTSWEEINAEAPTV